MAGLVGMGAMFAGASHALLASVVFAFETTRQPVGLLPLLTGSTAAFLVAQLLNRHSIMTEKLARRGSSIRPEYSVDYLSHVLVRDEMTAEVATLRAGDSVAQARAWLASGAKGTSHQGFPVLDEAGLLEGVVTRRDLLQEGHDAATLVAEVIHRRPIVVFDDNTLRDAADHMVVEQVGRLPVVTRENPRRVVGIVSRSDLLAAHARAVQGARQVERGLSVDSGS